MARLNIVLIACSVTCLVFQGGFWYEHFFCKQYMGIISINRSKHDKI